MQEVQRMSPNLVMRDPYNLDFLGLRDTWQESDLEAAILREMQSFLLELGVGFTFVARQKRIQLGDSVKGRELDVRGYVAALAVAIEALADSKPDGHLSANCLSVA
jgi:hypothetical protein